MRADRGDLASGGTPHCGTADVLDGGALPLNPDSVAHVGADVHGVPALCRNHGPVRFLRSTGRDGVRHNTWCSRTLGQAVATNAFWPERRKSRVDIIGPQSPL